MYREPPVTIAKTVRLLTFLNNLLRIIPINPKKASPGAGAMHPAANAAANQPFPLGQLFEDLTLTLSLATPSALPVWVVTIQFMLSCLRTNSQQALSKAGITTPIILGIIKHVLLELTRLPPTDMDVLQKQCFSVGKQLLDLFLVRDHLHQQQQQQQPQQQQQQQQPQKQQPFSANNEARKPTTGIGNVSYYDVVYSVSIS